MVIFWEFNIYIKFIIYCMTYYLIFEARDKLVRTKF